MNNTITTQFTKTFCIDSLANIYTYETQKNTYEIYRERTFKNNGTSKCDGDWLVQINGSIYESFSTLKEAKNSCTLYEMF